ncbi:MAG: SDR family NAD(P)-dependent oxidoreductase [Lachnospiraceae bacterium]
MKKAVLITGASSGLGLEFTKIFAKQCKHLVLVARKEKKLRRIQKKLQERYGIDVEIFPQDLAEKDAAKKIYHFIKEKELCVQVLINNAGFGDFGAFASCDLEKQREMMQVNMVTLTELTRLFLPQMIEQKSGKILNTASIAAFQPGPLMSVYFASKSYVLSFTEALAVELQGSGVTVTALCPGTMDTGFETRAELGESGLFKNIKTLPVSEVARYGYRALMQGKTVVVPGLANKILTCAAQIAPRKMVRKLSYRIVK